MIEIWASGFNPEYYQTDEELQSLVDWLQEQLPTVHFHVKTYHLLYHPEGSKDKGGHNYIFIQIDDNLQKAQHVIDTLSGLLPPYHAYQPIVADFSNQQQSQFIQAKYPPGQLPSVDQGWRDPP